MSTSYASPGVYVQEIAPTSIRPIEAAGMSLPAFVGITREASLKKLDRRSGDYIPVSDVSNQPVLIDTWTQFSQVFGGFVAGAYLPDAVYYHFANGGGPCYVVSLRTLDGSADDGSMNASVDVPSKSKKSFTVTAKTSGEIGNRISVVIKNEVDKEGKPAGTFSMMVDGEMTTGLTLKKGENQLQADTFTSVTISDIGTATAMPEEGTYLLSGGGLTPLMPEDFLGNALERTGVAGLEAIEEIRLLACPDLMTGYDGSLDAKERVKAVQSMMVSHCENMRFRFAILDTPPGLNAQEAREWRRELNIESSFAAMYYPWVMIPDYVNRGTKLVPPSGHVIGVYNRVDADRGVHKAPANETVNGAVGLEYQVSRGEQDILNPIGINCIRSFPNRGIRIWGARTLDSSGAWRYINVRRLFIMIAASMDAGLQWAVFEPNDSRLWARIDRDVTGFLRGVWRSGAFFGDTEDQAFYVKCDAELNSEEVRDNGQLIVEVGVAPVKPAEFVIFRLTQWAGMAADEDGEEGDDAEVASGTQVSVQS
ncbi:MAG: phage tail sheath subtilisin-like domain-containing protein [Chloroflexota bacterium]